MRTLVTGAAGFIGSHLCERLLKDGHTVFGLDDLSVGRIANVRHLLDNDRFAFSQSDVELEDYLPEVDWVFHLAAKADIIPSIVDPLEYHRTNVSGTVRLLQLAQKHQVKRFIYAASSSCYGIPSRYPTKETSAIDCRYPYALTKWLGEEYVMHWHKAYKLPAVSLRLFNVFGPRSRTSGTYGAVFGVFLAQLANRKPLTIVGDGSQRRDFTFVDDVVDAFVLAAEAQVEGEIFNVGTGEPQSVNQIVSMFNPEAGTVALPKRPGEPDLTHADISKIKIYLNWHPKTPFSVGVKKLLDHMDDFKNAPVWTQDTIE
jgi:UDP-glucose 4-epimerase